MIWNQVFLIILNYTAFEIETKTFLGQFSPTMGDN